MTLTLAEHETMCLYAAGLTCADVARRMSVDRSSVNTRIRRGCAKLGIARDRRVIAVAMQSAVIGWQRGRIAGRGIGWVKGDPLTLIGGRYVGRTATFVRLEGARQVSVRIGGGVVAVLRTNVQPIHRAGNAAGPHV